MWDPPSLIVTVDWSASVATVAVQGELDSETCARLGDRLAGVAASHPSRLVLDLLGVADRCSEQALSLIEMARRQLPPGCLVDVWSASRAVRRGLGTAGWAGVRVSTDRDAWQPQPVISGRP
jgi:hypothetical protein